MDNEQLLREVILRRRPDLVDSLSDVWSSPVYSDLRKKSQLIVADELVEFGLDERDEPNAYGDRLSGLLGRLGREGDSHEYTEPRNEREIQAD